MSSPRVFRQPTPLSPEEWRSIAARDVADEVRVGLVSVALYEPDLALALDAMYTFARHPHEEVRGNAILGFGHLARRFGMLDLRARPVIEAALEDGSDYVRGQARCAAEDASTFLGWTFAGCEDEPPIYDDAEDDAP